MTNPQAWDYLWIEAILDSDCGGGSWQVQRRTGAPPHAEDSGYWTELSELLNHFGRQRWELVELSNRIESSSEDQRTMTYRRTPEEPPAIWEYIYIETIPGAKENDLTIFLNGHNSGEHVSLPPLLDHLRGEGWELVYHTITDRPEAVLKRKG